MRRLLDSICALHRQAAPASTLLGLTLLVLLCAGAGFGAHEWRTVEATSSRGTLRARLDTHVGPGGRLEVAVDGAGDARFQAYLPGLDLRRVALAYDAERGEHRGALTVPPEAPARGYFTLRLVDERAREWDVRVALGAAPVDA